MSSSRASKSHPGSLVFAILFVAFAGFLVTQLSSETKFSSKGQLFAQPRFWPAVGVIGMIGFGLAHLWHQRWNRLSGELGETVIWLRALEYLGWFMIYVTAVPIIGYLAATILFTTGLAFRQGYRNREQLGLAAGLGLSIVLIFKTGLAVKIPGGAIYEYLPSALRNFMIVYF